MSTNIITDAQNIQAQDVLSENCLDPATMENSFITWLNNHHTGIPKTWTLPNTGAK